MMVPNLFSFAPNELSQDALLMWLADWGRAEYKDQNPALHALGRRFMTTLIRKRYPDASPAFTCLKVSRQWKRLDVLIEVDKEWVIMIEDKTTAQEHNDQLERYKDLLEIEFRGWQPVLIYLKTGNEPLGYRKTVEEKGYQVVYRKELLSWLPPIGDIRNDILRDFVLHLTDMEVRTHSWQYATLLPNDWLAGEGLFMALEERLRERLPAQRLASMDWRYVSNSQGGFLGFWYGLADSLPSLYIQVEFSTPGDNQGKLEISIRADMKQMEGLQHLDTVYTRLAEAASWVGIPLQFGKRPSRHATTARIAVVSPPAYDGSLDLLTWLDRLLEQVEVVIG